MKLQKRKTGEMPKTINNMPQNIIRCGHCGGTMRYDGPEIHDNGEKVYVYTCFCGAAEDFNAYQMHSGSAK